MVLGMEWGAQPARYMGANCKYPDYLSVSKSHLRLQYKILNFLA